MSCSGRKPDRQLSASAWQERTFRLTHVSSRSDPTRSSAAISTNVAKRDEFWTLPQHCPELRRSCIFVITRCWTCWPRPTPSGRHTGPLACPTRHCRDCERLAGRIGAVHPAVLNTCDGYKMAEDDTDGAGGKWSAVAASSRSTVRIIRWSFTEVPEDGGRMFARPSPRS